MNDPFIVLGLPAHASVADIRAARRRLALECHPDQGGSEEAMKALNVAFEAAVAHATGRRPIGGVGATPSSSPAPSALSPFRSPSSSPGRPSRPVRGVEHDSPSFTIDVLPVEAYEALLVVTSWIGEVLVDEPPYLLDVHLYEPSRCWCRLELVPDAGGSTVSITVAGFAGSPAPDVEAVRDTWVGHLNQLGRA